jgi:hypothetical protein
VSILGDLAGHVVTDLGVQASDEHEPIELVSTYFVSVMNRNLRLLHDAGNLLLVSSKASN